MKQTINQDWLTTEDKASLLTEKELRLMGPRRRDFPFFEALGAALAVFLVGLALALVLVGFFTDAEAHELVPRLTWWEHAGERVCGCTCLTEAQATDYPPGEQK